MRKTTRIATAFIVCTAFVVIILGLLGWATAGFQNWDSATWFNNWGKGKGKVTKVAESPIEQRTMVMTSANAGLTYDSDEAEKTVSVTVLDSPDYQLVTNKSTFFEMGMNFYTKGLWGNKLSVEVYCNLYDDFPYFSKEFTYSSANVGTPAVSEQHFLSFGEILNNSENALSACSYENVIYVKACNVGFSDYLDSVCFYKYVYVPDTVQSNLLGTFDGTTFKIPLPYEYGSSSGSMGGSGTARYYDFVVADGNKDTAYNYDVFCGSAFGSSSNTGIIACVRDIDDYVAFENSHSISLLSATLDESNIYNIDLTQLSFSSMLTSEAHIYVIPRYNVSYYSCDVVLPKYDYAFAVSKLATPTNITFSNGVLSWDEVDGAMGYGVFYGNGGGRVVDTPEVDLSDIITESGYYTFRVRALGNVGSTLTLADNGISVSAYNASSNISPLVALTYNVNGDMLTKFVPIGAKLSTYLYEVNVPNKEFYGWYYDSGFSRKVENSDTLSDDTVIYARLTDIKITERPLSWWDMNKWKVLVPIFVVFGLGIIVAVVVGIRKRKAA